MAFDYLHSVTVRWGCMGSRSFAEEVLADELLVCIWLRRRAVSPLEPKVTVTVIESAYPSEVLLDG